MVAGQLAFGPTFLQARSGSMRNVCSSPTCSVVFGFALLACAACSESSDDGVSYKTEIRPLLQARCVLCHYESSQLDLDVDPFRPNNGLFAVANTYFAGHGGLQYNVVPHDPDASFLIRKVTDLDLVPDPSCDPFPRGEQCPNESAGLFMPPHPPPLKDAQVKIVSDWIQAGATDTPEFRNSVVPIFGIKWRFSPRDCGNAGYDNFCVPCITCHYDNAPTTPNLQVPNFEDMSLSVEEQNAAVAEWLQTIVGVKAHFRADLDLIAPFKPEASFLLMKLTAKEPSSPLGAPMPYGLEPLSGAQVDLLRRWILEGARDN